MIAGVTWNRQHLHGPVEQLEAIPPLEATGLKRNPRPIRCRGPHLSGRPALQQLRGATDVVVMVMGLQHHLQAECLLLKQGDHRCSNSWIHNGSGALGSVHQSEHVVVPQHGQPQDLHHNSASLSSVRQLVKVPLWKGMSPC